MACLTFTTTHIDQWYAELAKQYYDNPALEVSWKDWKGKNDVTTQVEITVSVRARRLLKSRCLWQSTYT